MQPSQIQSLNYFAIAGVPRRNKRALGYKDVITAVSGITGISFDEMKRKIRKREIVQARQITWHIMRTELYPQPTLKTIADMFNGFDHTTITHNLKTCDNYMQTDENYLDIVNRCKIALHSSVLIAHYDSQVKAVIVE